MPFAARLSARRGRSLWTGGAVSAVRRRTIAAGCEASGIRSISRRISRRLTPKGGRRAASFSDCRAVGPFGADGHFIFAAAVPRPDFFVYLHRKGSPAALRIAGAANGDEKGMQ